MGECVSSGWKEEKSEDVEWIVTPRGIQDKGFGEEG
jgi:hypothetical protein